MITWQKRDAEWMGQIHEFLGLKVGVVLNSMEPKKSAGKLMTAILLRNEQRTRFRLSA